MNKEDCVGEYDMHQECRTCAVTMVCKRKYQKLYNKIKGQIIVEYEHQQRINNKKGYNQYKKNPNKIKQIEKKKNITKEDVKAAFREAYWSMCKARGLMSKYAKIKNTFLDLDGIKQEIDKQIEND